MLYRARSRRLAIAASRYQGIHIPRRHDALDDEGAAARAGDGAAALVVGRGSARGAGGRLQEGARARWGLCACPSSAAGPRLAPSLPSKVLSTWDACGGISSYGSNASDPTFCCEPGSACEFQSVGCARGWDRPHLQPSGRPSRSQPAPDTAAGTGSAGPSNPRPETATAPRCGWMAGGGAVCRVRKLLWSAASGP